VLIIGPRGMGKTTLLCAIAACISLREPDLSRQWQPVVFDEESRRVGDLADFWLECIRQWEGAIGQSSQRLDQLLGLAPDVIEQRARESFLELIDASGKRALLLIDNFNDVLEAIRDEEAQCRLREFLMSDSRVMIVGAATRWFQDVTNLDRPFYEFFRPFELRALSLEEMQECLVEVARLRGDERVTKTLREKPGSVRALHLLTGGNPRLIRTFYRMLSEGLHGELKQQLERLIDDYTPYVKAILDVLPGQQQKVLDAIALHWNPCDVATIARQTRLKSNQVSAQVKELEKRGMVCESVGMSRAKKRSYMMTDRFSNIHYLMRHGRAGQSRLHWFVMTLRVLFDDQEFADQAAAVVRMTAQGVAGSGDGLQLASSVLEYAESPQARLRFLDRVTGSPEFDKEIDLPLAEQICREALAKNPSDPVVHFKWGRLLAVHLRQFEEAKTAFLKAIELDPNYALLWHNLGILLSEHFAQHEEAKGACLKAIELDPNYGYPHGNLAILLAKNGNELESRTHAILGIHKQPDQEFCQRVFRWYCFEDVDSLRQALPAICEACWKSKGNEALVLFTVDVWLALASVAGAEEAERVMSQQPENVRMIFESVGDAFRAALDAKHLDRLAPERRAVTLELMRKFTRKP
jgi:tetratricopeptide (TPR) repeat protein